MCYLFYSDIINLPGISFELRIILTPKNYRLGLQFLSKFNTLHRTIRQNKIISVKIEHCKKKINLKMST